MFKEIAEVLGLLALVFPFTYLFKVVLDLKSRVSYLEAKIETYRTVLMEIYSQDRMCIPERCKTDRFLV